MKAVLLRSSTSKSIRDMNSTSSGVSCLGGFGCVDAPSLVRRKPKSPPLGPPIVCMAGTSGGRCGPLPRFAVEDGYLFLAGFLPSLVFLRRMCSLRPL